MRRDTVAATDPRRDVADDLHTMLIEAINDSGAHIGALYLFDEDDQVLRMDASLGFPTMIARAWARIRLTSSVPVAVAVRERRLVWLANQEELARTFPGAALALPYHFSIAAAPIHSGAADWGALLLLWPPAETAELTQHKLDTIQRTCRQMSHVLGEAAREGRSMTPRHRPRILSPYRAAQADFDSGLAALDCLNGLPEGYFAMDIDGRITFLTPPAAELLGDEASELLGKRPWEWLPWLNKPHCEDRYRAAVISHETTSFMAERPDGQWLAFQLYPAPFGVSVRVIPSTMARDVDHLLPDVPASANKRATGPALYDMLHLTTALSQATTVQDVVDLVADHVLPVFDVQATAVLRAESGRMRIIGSRNYAQETIEDFDGRPVTSPTPSAHALVSGMPLFFSTWRELAQVYPETIRYDDMSAWAFLPLIASGRPVGAWVLAFDHPHHFTTDERAHLTGIAGLLAQALERARLYDAKHQLAQALQSSLLPRRLPELPGLDVAARYLPATRGMDIGGDFYDLIDLGDHMAAAVIGDVQGHDTTAAALMGQVRSAIHAYARAGSSPGDVLRHTNRLLTELSPNRFTSCLYVSLDLSRGLACMASAGHLPPLLHSPGAPVGVLESPPGLLLGIDADAEYPTTEFELPPGAVLALYTDGLIESPGIDLGDAILGLAAELSRLADQPLQSVAETLIAPSAAVHHRTDDIAMLLLRTSRNG
ncbi:SpoIIE family protein phosphatase [Nonomuraea glycinis]|uniref:SpoIIE family protein phosphatase n=1 Tax=Nonomuraea glycinis TaxID=2047744 RepID=UPI002E0D1BFF|nr:SpoIIE family protein phosphatase [Nonomuraea glycinis]